MTPGQPDCGLLPEAASRYTVSLFEQLTSPWRFPGTVPNVQDADGRSYDIEVDAVTVRPPSVKELPDGVSRSGEALDHPASLRKPFKRIKSLDEPVIPFLSFERSFFGYSPVYALSVLRRARHQPNAECHIWRAFPCRTLPAKCPRPARLGQALRLSRRSSDETPLRPLVHPHSRERTRRPAPLLRRRS